MCFLAIGALVPCSLTCFWTVIQVHCIARIGIANAGFPSSILRALKVEKISLCALVLKLLTLYAVLHIVSCSWCYCAQCNSLCAYCDFRRGFHFLVFARIIVWLNNYACIVTLFVCIFWYFPHCKLSLVMLRAMLFTIRALCSEQTSYWMIVRASLSINDHSLRIISGFLMIMRA